jgi:hypothetical protein
MRKALEIKEVGKAGEVAAVIATLNVKDKDGDVTLPGFFGVQHPSIVTSHNWNDIMLGKGKLEEQGDQAIFEGRFNLDDPDAVKLHSKLKFDIDNPPAQIEWSYNLRLKDGARVPFKGDAVYGDGQWLGPVNGEAGVKVNEVSPVLIGAGENTGTLGVKSADPTLAEMIKTSNALLTRIAQDVLALDVKLTADGHQLTDEKRAQLAALVEELEKTLATVSPVLIETTPTDDGIMKELLQVQRTFARIRELETI